MNNFKGKKQQHTQQINKMFYVLKKRGIQISVCVVKTKSSERLVNGLSGLKR